MWQRDYFKQGYGEGAISFERKNRPFYSTITAGKVSSFIHNVL